MYQEEESSTFTHDGKEYNLNGVLRASEYIPVRKASVKGLEWVLKYTEIDEDRVDKADLYAPILVALDQKGRATAIDGAHRLTKAIRLKWKSLPAKWVSKKILRENLIEPA